MMRHMAKRTCEMLLAPEVPRTPGGGVALCHLCQRNVFFKGGFLLLLAETAERIAKRALAKRGRR